MLKNKCYLCRRVAPLRKMYFPKEQKYHKICDNCLSNICKGKSSVFRR